MGFENGAPRRTHSFEQEAAAAHSETAICCVHVMQPCLNLNGLCGLSKQQLAKKKQIFSTFRCTSHWPLPTSGGKIFPPARTYGQEDARAFCFESIVVKLLTDSNKETRRRKSAGDLSRVKTLCRTGSVVHARGREAVYFQMQRTQAVVVI